MKKNRKRNNPAYGMEATTTSKDWGYIPVPCKGGKTTNFETPADMFKRELAEYLLGGTTNA